MLISEGLIDLYNDDKIEKIPHENICYRCPDEIVEACSKLIKHNKKRIDKTWRKSNKQGKLNITQTKNQFETNEYVLARIKEIYKAGRESSTLILSPVGFAAKPFIPMLIENGFEPNDYWSKKIDIDLLQKIWILRSIYTKHQILNLLLLSYTYKHFSNKTFISTISEHIDKDVRTDDFRDYLIKKLKIDDKLKEYMIESPELEDIKTNYEEYTDIIKFIDEDKIEESLSTICQRIHPPIDFKKDGINIMSIHKSKGLQADYVFIVGLVSGILPNSNYGLDSIEAQRRLLFVGMSRALKELNIVSNVLWKAEYIHKVDKNKFKFAHWIRGPIKKYAGQISDFINEINEP